MLAIAVCTVTVCPAVCLLRLRQTYTDVVSPGHTMFLQEPECLR